jgi:hypothetical protein
MGNQDRIAGEVVDEEMWWGLEDAKALHVQRLRGPWGRLYAKELDQLRQGLTALHSAPLPDPLAEKQLLAQRK